MPTVYGVNASPFERAYPNPPLYPSGPYEDARALWFEEYGDTALLEAIVGKRFSIGDIGIATQFVNLQHAGFGVDQRGALAEAREVRRDRAGAPLVQGAHRGGGGLLRRGRLKRPHRRWEVAR